MNPVLSFLTATARILKTVSHARLARYLMISCFIYSTGVMGITSAFVAVKEFSGATMVSRSQFIPTVRNYSAFSEVINTVTPNTISRQDTNNSAVIADVPVPVKLTFITAPLTATVGQCGSVASLPITVQLQDAGGNKAQAATNTTVNLTSSSTAGSFYSDAQCTRAVTSVVISNAGNAAGFYYKDTIDGLLTIMAADASGGLISATQVETILAPPSACVSPGFSAGMNFVVGPLPLSVAVGDFNGDGKADVVAANNSSTTVSILIGNGAGGFAAATNFTVGANPRSVAIGDFNGDGEADVIAANHSSNNVSMLLGNGAGGFAAATNFAVGSLPFSVAVGDFNADGRADVVTGNFNSIVVSILLNNGAGGFAAATNFTVGVGAQSVAVGDFNADGKADIAVGKQASSNNVSILLGNGAGGFAAATNFTVPATPLSVAIADFNLDGRADLATANSNSNNVSILLGNGLGSFAAAMNFPVGTAPAAIAIGDFNSDGKDDIATGNQSSNNISILLGNGAGGFGTASNFTAAQPRSVATGDFNSDGRPDVVAAIFANPSSVSILLNSCISAPDLTLTKTHTGNFTIGTNANYALTVSNATGAAATSGTITITDILPTGLSFVSSTGSGWSCSASGQNVTCANSDSLASGTSSPTLTLIVSVGAGTAVGTYSVTNTAHVSITGETNTGNNTASDLTTVDKGNQTITFGALADKSYGDADFAVSATASSGLTVSYTAGENCTVSGTMVHIAGAGNCTITASQEGSASFDAAPDVAQSFTINKAASTATVSVGNATYDGQPHGATASVTGLGGLSQTLTVTYVGRNATVYGSSTTPPTDAGEYTASASFGGDNDHNSSSDTKNFTIDKAEQAITWGDPAPVLYGTALSAAQLNAAIAVIGPAPAEALIYTPALGTVLHAGAHQPLTISVAATQNYNAAAKTVYLGVQQATPVITWNMPAAIAYGTALSTTQLNATAAHPTVAGPLSGTAVAGAFVYTPAVGAVLPGGDSTLSVVFNPANTADYTTAIGSVIQHVGVIYNICPLYDQTKAARSGSTIPIKLKLCSATGANLSSPSVVVSAIGMQLVSTNSWGEVEDSGNANPDVNFRYTVFDETTPGYIFNLKTTGLASGVYELGFTVGGDQTVYTVQFQIK